MAHRSYLSPDRKWVLLVEMDIERVATLPVDAIDGSSPGKPVGPGAGAVYGCCLVPRWEVDVFLRQYRQRVSTSGGSVSRRRPEQVTSGATQEEGIAFAPDGRSFVTSIGTSQSTLWFHDSRGDRQITSEGYPVCPQFSADGKKLYYLTRARASGADVSGELWVANLETGKRQRLLPDFLMQHYSVSPDGKRVVFVRRDDGGRSPVWLATLDGSSPPRRLASWML